VERQGVFDVGSGAGFPGLIFAIRFPGKKITLYESNHTKQTFLHAVATELKLDNVMVKGAAPEKFEPGVIVSRATIARENLFGEMAKRMNEKNTLIVCEGGESQSTPPPDFQKTLGFQKTDELYYQLPEKMGGRVVSAFVSRGTEHT